MKKRSILTLLMAISLVQVYAQSSGANKSAGKPMPKAGATATTCEKREQSLLSLVGAFGAMTLYNTYTTIGGVSDAYIHKSYDSSFTTSLLKEQVAMLKNVLGQIADARTANAFAEESDIQYVDTIKEILEGLKKQAEAMLGYIKNKDSEMANAYDITRKKTGKRYRSCWDWIRKCGRKVGWPPQANRFTIA